MKGCVLFVMCLIAGLSTPIPLYACDHLQAKVERYTTLKRRGGSAKQMNQWEGLKKDYAARYRECLKAQPKVHRAGGGGKKSKRVKVEHQQPRRINSKIEDPVIHKLLATCNFWIDTYNHNPTPDHQSYRDTACRALDEAEQKPPAAIVNPPDQRSLKACIKPDNLLDEEVRECMAGIRDPDWQ